MEQTLPIHTFKAQCYQLSQQVAAHELHLVITKHGKPLMRILPFEAPPVTGKLNTLQGTALLKDDLVASVDAPWSMMETTL